MTILQTECYPIPVIIENITASAHITYCVLPSCGTYTLFLETLLRILAGD